MTKAEKKMKRYTTAVEHRLNLPRELKARVMSDFVSSISARREAGMTDEDIYAELGSPQKAAQELNKQMKEFTYRKSPWRFAGLVLALYALWRLLAAGISLGILWRLTHQNAASIGIIGGADGPTAIFLTATVPAWTKILLMVLCLVLGIWLYWRLCRCGKKE